MFGWGVNSHGQLGLGPSSASSFISVPERIAFFNNCTCIQVACSLTHSLFLLDDGDVYSAGNNEYSQLGREGRTTIPGKIEQEETMLFFLLFLYFYYYYYLGKVTLPSNEEGVQVACGQNFSTCLTSNGRVVIWGSISGKVTDDGFLYSGPAYVSFLFSRKLFKE